ncbi:MAG: hypothetical protein J0L63_06830 [Anaerolineae bacterium]|nr:hypothetical protein [Anaerolineae bacterium]MBN8618600.1 hypothetical protein [Anaerolineae bacterium]
MIGVIVVGIFLCGLLFQARLEFSSGEIIGEGIVAAIQFAIAVVFLRCVSVVLAFLSDLAYEMSFVQKNRIARSQRPT